MTAKNKSRSLALLAAILSVFMLLTLTVMPAFAEEAATEEAATEEAATGETATGEASTGEAATGEAATGEAATDAATGAETSATTEAVTEEETNATSSGMTKEQRTRGIINIIVGVVILLAAGALAFVFRKKIPGWLKALKSECGKIVWCPKDKLKKNSIVVLVTIVVLAVAIGLLDFGFSRGIMLLRDIFQ